MLKKILNNLKQHKPVLIAAGFIFAIIFAMAWVSFDELRSASDKTQTEPITEISDATTENLQNGVSVIQPFETNSEIHGMVLQVATFQKIVLGKLNIRVLSSDYTELAAASHDMGPIKDSELFTVIFDRIVPAADSGNYFLELTANYDEGEQDPVAIWLEKNAESGLSVNGKDVRGLLHADIVTNYSKTFIGGIYLVICVLTLIALIACAVLIFEIKLSLPKAFAAACVLLGLAYITLIPPHWAPDEKTHVNTAYSYSNFILGVKNIDGILAMREQDLSAVDRFEKLDVFAYQKAQNLFGRADNSSPYVAAINNRYVSGFNACYIPSTLGLTTARVLGFNYVTMVFMGRLFNLLAYAAIAALAIKLAPFAKPVYFAVAILPMSLSLAASFSYDALLIAFAMLFVAITFKFTCEEKSLGYKQIIPLCAAAAFLAPTKGIYVFICGLCLNIPKARFATKKLHIIFKSCVLTFAALVFLSANFKTVKYYLTINSENINYSATLDINAAEAKLQQKAMDKKANEEAAASAEPEIDYVERFFYNPPYALTHLKDVAKITVNTLQENTLYYAKQVVGGYLSEPILVNIEINGIFVAMLYAMLFLSTLRHEDEKSTLSVKQRLFGGFLIACMVGVLYIVVLSWTPVRYETLWGMQGRYLLPMLPLAMLLIPQKTLRLQRDITPALTFSAVWLNAAVILNAFTMIAK